MIVDLTVAKVHCGTICMSMQVLQISAFLNSKAVCGPLLGPGCLTVSDTINSKCQPAVCNNKRDTQKHTEAGQFTDRLTTCVVLFTDYQGYVKSSQCMVLQSNITYLYFRYRYFCCTHLLCMNHATQFTVELPLSVMSLLNGPVSLILTAAPFSLLVFENKHSAYYLKFMVCKYICVPCCGSTIVASPSFLCFPAVATTVMEQYVLYWRPVRVASVAAGLLSCKEDSPPPSGRQVTVVVFKQLGAMPELLHCHSTLILDASMS